MTSERHGALSRLAEGRDMRSRHRDAGPSTGWIVAGVVVVGLGVLTWAYLGPDLKRYLKIYNM
jgi:hypothetical protein